MSLSIAINKPPGEGYVPGEMIVGTVTVDVMQPINCECLLLSFIGRADVEIIEIHHHHHNHHHNHHHSHSSHFQNDRTREVYVAEEIYLSGTLTLVGPCTLAQGRTVFPFQYSLPTEALPCSFTASHGKINYSILAELNSPNIEFGVREGIVFMVAPLLDLNKVNLQDFMPTEVVDEKPVGCTCCRGDDALKYKIQIPKRHFVPGEVIRFTVILDNCCDKDLLSPKMELVMMITCMAQGRIREDEALQGQVLGPPVPKRTSKTWIVDNFFVPVTTPVGLPPTGLGGCNIIDVQYVLKVLIKSFPSSLELFRQTINS